jgi:hypothetical protein
MECGVCDVFIPGSYEVNSAPITDVYNCNQPFNRSGCASDGAATVRRTPGRLRPDTRHRRGGGD